MTRDPDALLAEVAFLASAYHWPLSTLLDLEHGDRRRFVELAAAEAEGETDADAAAVGW